MDSYSINCKGVLLSLESPIVMGILNLTENSFFDGGRYLHEKETHQRIEEIFSEGAKIIDLGAASSKAGTKLSNPPEESEKLLPLIQYINHAYPQAIISIDTYHSQVAEACLDMGAHIINDISGGLIDSNMYQTVAKHQAPYVLMHMQGTPEIMQLHPHYKHIIQDIIHFLSVQCQKAVDSGIQDILIDPGFGFGKTISDNLHLLNHLETFQIFKRPILVGLSRKSTIWKTLQVTPQDSSALTGTIALNMFALQKGAHILRVHDVKEAVDTIHMYQALRANS